MNKMFLIAVFALTDYWNLPPVLPYLRTQDYHANASGGSEVPEVFCYICMSEIIENNKGGIIV